MMRLLAGSRCMPDCAANRRRGTAGDATREQAQALVGQPGSVAAAVECARAADGAAALRWIRPGSGDDGLRPTG